MTPTISVVILTQNRAAMLRDCLEALNAQTRPPDEVVVVDNGSTDSTLEMLAQYADRFAGTGLAGTGLAGTGLAGTGLAGTGLAGTGLAGPREPSTSASGAGEPDHTLVFPLKIVHGGGEGKGGLAAARNLGAREASGDWIAFTDDDCLPREDWLAWIAVHAEQDIVDAVGGLAEPAGHMPYPWWWHPDMAWAPGLSVPGHRGPLAGSVYYPQTANWAMRRSVLLAEPFREIPANLSGGKRLLRAEREDADLWRRLRRNGYRTRFDARMAVRHRVDVLRLEFRNVLRRATRDGVALQRHEPRREFLANATDTLVSLPANLLSGIWGTKHAPWREAAWHIVWAVRQAGQWREALDRMGKVKGSAFFVWMAASLFARKAAGLLKASAMHTGVALARAWRGIQRRKSRARVSTARPPRSIVVAACGYLGDLALLHPCITALKSERPEVEITLLTNRLGEEVYRHDPAIRQIVVLGGDKDRRGGDPAAIRFALRAMNAELILIPYFYGVAPRALFSLPKARVATFKEEVGFARRRWYDLADKRIAKPNGRPEIENLLHLFAEAGLREPLEESPLAFLPDEWIETDNLMRESDLSGENLVLVAPGSGKENKLWVEKRWAEVVRYLVEEYGAYVALSGAPSEEPMCRRIAEASGKNVAVWCQPSVRQMALHIARARLLVTCDNGCKHLAVAMDTPSLTLFGPTDERQWGAMRHLSKHGVVRGCAFGLTEEERAGLPLNHQMLCIGTQQVLSALDEMLGER